MMATTTVIAVFDNYSDAEDARADLANMGVPERDLRITANDSADIARQQADVHRADDDDGASFGQRVAHFFRSLFGSDDDADHAGRYSEAVRRGSCVLTAVVEGDDARAEAVTDVLRRHDAIDIDERAEQWRSRGWTGFDPTAQPLSSDELEQERQYAMRPVVEAGTAGRGETGIANATTEEATLPVIEEELKVGKRQVRAGGVRVYTRTTERPVEEQINLKEERATVERRPVDRPASAADIAGIEEKTVEVIETTEEPVVSKTARVVEEVVIGKEVRERTESVGDIVRRTDVEVEQLDSNTDAEADAVRSRVGRDSDKPAS
jgi:uncharacterized protein (TIGR02271 family)